jgi:3-deoxy-7-phosphoheptulonate synthase
MILNLTSNATEKNALQLMQRLEMMGFKVMLCQNEGRFSLAIVSGFDDRTHFDQFATLPFVEQVLPSKQKYMLVSKQLKKDRTVIEIGDKKIGDGALTVIAGSCSVESEAQIFETAQAVSQLGATILRGGAFKPRTSPYDFQGLGEEGLRYLQAAARAHNMASISEVMDSYDVDLVAKYVDILQIGARNMQNFSLLKQVGRLKKPILLKRGFSATYHDLLFAAEYILSEGNSQVMLCERGIRTFESYTRNTLDIAAVPVLRELTHLPIVVDPSHGTGIRKMVIPMARAAVAVGVDGLMIEVHPDPDNALSDAQQTISPAMFAEMMESLRLIGKAVNVRVN